MKREDSKPTEAVGSAILLPETEQIARTTREFNPAWRIVSVLLAIALMALAANCFLKYLWWSACYSAWSGIPKLAGQCKAAGMRASLNGWGVILLELASILVVCSFLRLRRRSASGFLKEVVHLLVSVAVTVSGTALFALALSWLKQDSH